MNRSAETGNKVESLCICKQHSFSLPWGQNPWSAVEGVQRGVDHGGGNAYCRLQSRQRTCPSPCKEPSLPPAPPQKALKIKQTSLQRKGRGESALLPSPSTSLAFLVSAVHGLNISQKAGTELSLCRRSQTGLGM